MSKEYDQEMYKQTGIKLSKNDWDMANYMCALMCPDPEPEEEIDDWTENSLGETPKAI